MEIGKTSLILDFFFKHPTWSLLEEYIIQNDTESLNVKGWTNFINHLQTEREQLISKQKNIEMNKDDHFYHNQKQTELFGTLLWWISLFQDTWNRT